MEIRFQNLSLRTEIPSVAGADGRTHELPTIANEFRKKPKGQTTKHTTYYPS
jgi:hypothetical protein